MRKFTLRIELATDAMQTAYDVADALQGIATALNKGPYTASAVIEDADACRVGMWEFGNLPAQDGEPETEEPR